MRSPRGGGISRSGRSAWLVGLAAGAVLAAALGAGAALAASPSPDATSGQGDAGEARVAGLPSAVAMPVLQPLPEATSPGATSAGLLTAIAPVLSGPGLPPPLGLVIADADSGQVLLDLEGDAPLVPASTVKLATATAALEAFDAEHTLSTSVVAPDSSTVVLVGGGDPLLTREPWPESGGSSLLQLAAVTAAELRASGRYAVQVAVDDSAFTGPVLGEGWEAEDVDLCLVTPITALRVFTPEPAPECVPDLDPSVTAGLVFAELLRDYGIEVSGEVGRRVVDDPAAPTLAAVASRPMAALVEQMLTDSDNVSAEMLGHLLGLKVGDAGSFAGGSAATLKILNELGVPTAELVLLDASGLSVGDRMTSSTANALVAAGVTTGQDALWPVSSGLPVAGSTGTLAERFVLPTTAAGRGDVRAKTGTLTGVSALSGQVVTASGQLLTFALITNGAEDILAAREAQDELSSILAQCGCTGDPA